MPPAPPALNLMKETLTVRLRHSPALDRGDALMLEYLGLLERGTDEQIWADEVKRGAAVRWNILKSRELCPAIEPTRAQLVMNAERLMKAGQLKPWGSFHNQSLSQRADGGCVLGLANSTHGPASSGNLYCASQYRGSESGITHMNKARKLIAAGVAIGMTVLAHAQTTPVDYGEVITDNLTVIDTLWGKVATIIIGVALVTVGARFFRKAK